MFRRITAIATAIILVCSMTHSAAFAHSTTDTSTNSQTASGETFQDIGTHWAKDYINALAAMKIINGTSETTFSPNQTMTRGMFITIIGRMASVSINDMQEAVSKLPFSDVKPDAYYAPYVAWALNNKIVSGVSENAFAPDQEITRQEMCVMMFNMVTFAGLTIEPGYKPVSFNDSNLISGWAVQSVGVLSAVGLIEGYNGNFNPKGLSTRAEAATVIAKFIYSIGTIE